MAIGKYLTNMGVIGALVGAMGVSKQTQSMPRDWRRIIVWLVWAMGLVLAIAAVSKQPEDEAYEAALKQHEKDVKAAAKAARKAR